jgi:hypothetical protein
MSISVPFAKRRFEKVLVWKVRFVILTLESVARWLPNVRNHAFSLKTIENSPPVAFGNRSQVLPHCRQTTKGGSSRELPAGNQKSEIWLPHPVSDF